VGVASTPTAQLRTRRTDPLPASESGAANETPAAPGPARRAGGRRWAIVLGAFLAGLLLWALLAAAIGGGNARTPPPARSPGRVHSSPPTTTLPTIPVSIVGMRQDDAVRALQDLGISVDSVVRVHVDKGRPDGVVTAVSPPAGSRVGPATHVTLYVSDSPGHGSPGKGPSGPGGGDEGGGHGNGPGHDGGGD
jgi:hypothetical protein